MWQFVSPSIGLTNLAKPYHVHYHLSQPDMAGATRRAPASVQRFALLADVRGNKACSTVCQRENSVLQVKTPQTLNNQPIFPSK